MGCKESTGCNFKLEKKKFAGWQWHTPSNRGRRVSESKASQDYTEQHCLQIKPKVQFWHLAFRSSGVRGQPGLFRRDPVTKGKKEKNQTGDGGTCL